MKLFLGNERQASEEWVRVSWPDEAITLLKTGNVTEIGIDSDLKSDQRGTGYDVIRWIAAAIVEQGFIPPRILVHSGDTFAQRKMEMGIRAIDAYSAAFLMHEDSADTTGFQAFGPILAQAVEHIDELFHRPDDARLSGLSTGFRDLDGVTLGFQPGDLIVVAGRPNMGKTTFALSIGEHMARVLGSTVAVFSMEMNAAQLALGMLGSVGMLDGYRLRTGKLQHEDWPKLTNALKKIEDIEFHIATPPFSGPRDICERTRRIAQQCGKLGLIIVDSIPLTLSYGKDRVAEISEMSRLLKSLALELNRPVLVISKLSHRVERRDNKRPTLVDLGESGSLVDAADLILFLYRDSLYHPDSPDAGTVEVIIAKQRNGPIGTIRLNFDSRYIRFTDIPLVNHA